MAASSPFLFAFATLPGPRFIGLRSSVTISLRGSERATVATDDDLSAGRRRGEVAPTRSRWRSRQGLRDLRKGVALVVGCFDFVDVGPGVDRLAGVLGP